MSQIRADRTPLFEARSRPILLALACIAGGCASAPPADDSTLLLVSLSDGSIISQRIEADADVCMKSNASPATTCLSRGEPLMDTTGQLVIGYQMERTEIDLFPQ